MSVLRTARSASSAQGCEADLEPSFELSEAKPIVVGAGVTLDRSAARAVAMADQAVGGSVVRFIQLTNVLRSGTGRSDQFGVVGISYVTPPVEEVFADSPRIADEIVVKPAGAARTFLVHRMAQAPKTARIRRPATPAFSATGFEATIVRALRDTPVEDGEHHPVEDELREALGSVADAPTLIKSTWDRLANSNATLAGNFLRCLGMLSRELVEPWGFEVAAEALGSRNVALREAAVIALERWEGSHAVELLCVARKQESVRWLRDYIEKVLSEYSEVDLN